MKYGDGYKYPDLWYVEGRLDRRHSDAYKPIWVKGGLGYVLDFTKDPTLLTAFGTAIDCLAIYGGWGDIEVGPDGATGWAYLDRDAHVALVGGGWAPGCSDVPAVYIDRREGPTETDIAFHAAHMEASA